MSEAFLKIVNMSISAGWLVLAVLALRLILKKAPKWVNVLLWGIVAVRLLCPISIESALSLIPSTQTISPEIMMDHTPEISTGIPALNNAINPIISDSFAPNPGDSANPLQILIPVAANIWILGMLVLLLYTAISYFSLRRKLRTATILRDNVYQCVAVDSPFVLGILRPKIYLPYQMEGQDLEHVVAHEQAHIRRKDHWWKPLGFLLLTVHWFNPLMWSAYILLCRDIELACDEKVIKEMGNEQRADYTQALVHCSINRRMIAACPLAFGEVGVKDRVRSILNYRKPTFWIMVTAVVACVAVAVCFLTDPIGTALTKWSIDEVDMTAALGDMHSMTVQYYGDSVACDIQDRKQFISTMAEINVGGTLVSQSRDEQRDQTFAIIIDEKLSLYFAEDFSTLWVDNGVKPSFSYQIINPEKAEELLLDFHIVRNGIAGGNIAEKWFDYLAAPEDMIWDGRLEINITEFQDVTFRWFPEQIAAVTEAGITPLYTGMPIWNTFFYDVTGDGLPELCSTLSIGSGMIDNRVIVYDYANGVSYELSDRGYHDYTLRLNEDTRQLYVDKKLHPNGELVSSGRLLYKDGCIQVEEKVILQAKLLHIEDEHFIVEPVEGSPELNSASRIMVPMRNMAPSPEPVVGDILQIEYDGILQETYPARITNVYHISVTHRTGEAYEPAGCSGDQVIELSDTPDNVHWEDGLGFGELAPGEESVSDFEIRIDEDATPLILTITWARQSLVLEYGIRAEDGTEYSQEKRGGASILQISDIPAGVYHLFVRNCDVYHGIPSYEDPDKFKDVSFDATGALIYAFDQ